MTSRLNEIVIDGPDSEALAQFWCAVLGWQVVDSGDDYYELRPVPTTDAEWLSAIRAGAVVPSLLIEPSNGSKASKNRVHLDVSPIDSSQADEVARLIALGATHADVGQSGDESWVVLADPAGNEFCVLRSLAEGQFALPPRDQ